MTDLFAAIREQRLKAFDRYFEHSDLPLRGEGKAGVAAWFLGPKAENVALLKELVVRAIEMHYLARRRFHPEDPPAITAVDRASTSYREAVKEFWEHAEKLFEALQLSAPIWSMRHQGHMLWDQVLPAVVGYFGAMLYNQNNVAAEASPLTTRLEIEVGNDLCRLLGFDFPPNPANNCVVPWGHITCDGSVANIEGLWAARNAKFLPIALRAALCETPVLAPARSLQVRWAGGAAPLVELDPWTLLNLDIDQIVDLPHRMEREFCVSTQVTTDALRPFTVQNIGLVEFYRRHLATVRPPVALAPATCHYSWPKAGTLLGLGQNNILRVDVDLQARMDVGHLKELLHGCHQDRVPVIAVVAVIGSTEEGAVDPLCDILKVRRELRALGLNFAVHCDAAWGGYFRSLLEDCAAPTQPPRPAVSSPGNLPALALSRYVGEQLCALKEADSVTIDPHKGGYVPYPAGALCYRNSATRDLVSLKAPVVFHSSSEPTVGIYGIEGSKPGAAAAGVYLAHRVIRPDKNGYGTILGECVWTATRLYCRLVTMKSKRFKIVFFQMLPSERDNLGEAAVSAEKEYIRQHLIMPSNAELKDFLVDNAYARELFAALGSDLVILAYSFNFIDKSGHLNSDLSKLAALNAEIFKLCSVTSPMLDMSSRKLILTSSSFTVADYGRAFVESYCRRLGVELRDEIAVPFLISTTMDPWTTDTPEGDFLAIVEAALRDAVDRAIDIIDPPPKPGS